MNLSLLLSALTLVLCLNAHAQNELVFTVKQQSSKISINSAYERRISLGQQTVLGGYPLATSSSGSSSFTYLWDPSTALNNHTLANPTASPTVSTRYRITVTDGNGCSNSQIVDVIVNGLLVGIQESMASSMNVFPNPSKGIISITSGQLTGNEYKLEVFNSLGVKLFDQQVNTGAGTLNVELPESVKGLFTLKLSGNDLLVTKKILVE